MSGTIESVNSIHDMTGKHEALSSNKRKQEDRKEGVVSKLPRTRQTKGEIPCNHDNGIASYGDAFSIDKILSPSTKDVEPASPRPTRPAKIDPARTTPSRDDKNKMVKNFFEERADTTDVENGVNAMPMDKWYDTLLWQQHQQQYQQHLAAASAFYHHQQHFHPHLPNITSPYHFSHLPPANGLPLMSGVPPTFCPRMPGRVHHVNCQCAEQINEQPYFLLTPAGYSIPSPFQPDQHYASTRYCRRRKARTVFTEYQIKGLEDRFVYQQYLSTLERVDLARVLFLTEAQVKTWFQNRRMKEKKLSRDTELPDDDDDDTNDDEEFDEEDEVGDDLDDKCCTKTLRIAPSKEENDG